MQPFPHTIIYRFFWKQFFIGFCSPWSTAKADAFDFSSHSSGLKMEQDAKIVHVKPTFFCVRGAEATMTAKYGKSLGHFNLPCVLPALPPPRQSWPVASASGKTWLFAPTGAGGLWLWCSRICIEPSYCPWSNSVKFATVIWSQDFWVSSAHQPGPVWLCSGAPSTYARAVLEGCFSSHLKQIFLDCERMYLTTSLLWQR